MPPTIHIHILGQLQPVAIVGASNCQLALDHLYSPQANLVVCHTSSGVIHVVKKYITSVQLQRINQVGQLHL